MQPTPRPRRCLPCPARRARGSLQFAGGGLATGSGTALPLPAGAVETGRIDFPPIDAPTEPPKKSKPLPLPDDKRVGFALVGLGRLRVERTPARLRKREPSRWRWSAATARRR